VAKTTVYRRYPTRLDLAVAAIAALVAEPPTASSLEDATTIGLSQFEEYMGGPQAGAAFLAVAGAAASDKEVHDRFTQTVLTPVQQNILLSYLEAVERGEAGPDADIEFVHDVLIGALLHRLVIRQRPMDPGFRDAFTDLVRFLYRDPR
jgi:AcrR family transcriptional regulator